MNLYHFLVDKHEESFQEKDQEINDIEKKKAGHPRKSEVVIFHPQKNRINVE